MNGVVPFYSTITGENKPDNEKLAWLGRIVERYLAFGNNYQYLHRQIVLQSL